MKAILPYALTLVASIALGAVIGSPPSPGSPPDPPTEPPPTHPAPETPTTSLAAIPDSDLPAHYTSTAGKDRDLVARFWSHAAPAAFLAHLNSTAPPLFSDPSHALYLFDTWATRDFDSAFAAALDLSPFNPLRIHIQHRVIAAKFATDPATAIASLEQVWANNGSTNHQLIPFLDTPENSLLHLTKLPRTDVAATAITRSLVAWAKTDPTAAIAWAEDNATPTTPIITSVWRDNPELALDLLSSLTPPRARSQTASNLAVNHLQFDSPEISIALVDNYLDGWIRTETARKLAKKLARESPRAATELALTFKSTAACTAALRTSLSLFARDAPRSLDHWLSALPENQSTRLILKTVTAIKASAAPPANTPPQSPAIQPR
ncbi:MAG: hypothetical protein P8J87_09740 [Verrucomicrobiales bacterium]|nr:hypothetical protein [Verrucomicrobiales bacterium]